MNLYLQLKMKIVILFVLLISFQGSYQYSVKTSRLNDLEQVVEDFAQALRKLREISNFIGIHFSTVLRDYELQIDDIVSNKNILPLIQSLQDSIQKIESEKNNSKNCGDFALRKAKIATDELERGVDSCIAVARIVGEEIKSFIYSTSKRVQLVQEDINNGFHKCVQEETTEQKVKCLREVIEPVKKELEELEEIVVGTNDVAHEHIEDGIRKLHICLQQNEEDFRLKSESILEELNDCVQNDQYSSSNYSFKNIMDIIEELREKINSILDILSHLPTSFEEIQDKINEIISHINISVIISQLKNEINGIISDGGSNAETCRPIANKSLDALVKSSEERISECLEAAENEVSEIKIMVSVLVDESQQILEDIKSQTLQCFNENKLNPVEFYKCVESHVGEFQNRVTELQSKATQTYNKAKDQAEEIIRSLATCSNRVQLDTIKEGQNIIKETENCVLTS